MHEVLYTDLGEDARGKLASGHRSQKLAGEMDVAHGTPFDAKKRL